MIYTFKKEYWQIQTDWLKKEQDILFLSNYK